MLEFFRILGLTILGIIALLVSGFFICWLMLWIWPIVIIALPIALIIYLVYLIKIAKPQKTKRSEK